MSLDRPLARVAEICSLAPVLPVISIEDVDQAAPLARALVGGGLPALLVSLRTPRALESIRVIRAEAPEAIVGAATLRRPADIDEALMVGAQFGACPGAPASVIDAALSSDMPVLPGCATPTEAMQLAEQGFEVLSLYPAGGEYGVNVLNTLAEPLADLKFSVSGGIARQNAASYLALPNVVCVGGYWLTPQDLVAASDWAAIQSLARDAAALGKTC